MKNYDYFFKKIFSEKSNDLSLKFDIFIMCLIFISALIFLFETSVKTEYQRLLLYSIDFFIIFIFSIELILRFYYYKSKKKFIFSIYNLIDIIAIVPFWFGFITFINLRALRLLRIFRTFRYLKYNSDNNFDDIELSKEYIEKLFIFRTIFTIFLIVFVVSSFIFELEHNINPAINTFFDSFYFTMVSITTVGYGDITPISKITKILIMFTVVSMILFVSTQLSNLIKYSNNLEDKKRVVCNGCNLSNHDLDAIHCKNCGKKLIFFQK